MTALPEPVDLDCDIRNRTPSGWPLQTRPPALSVMLAGTRHTFAQRPHCANTGAVLWPISRLLSRYVEAHATQFAGKRVLELGAGAGLVGVAAAAYGAHVTLTDADVALLTRENAAAAAAVGLAGSVAVEQLRWEEAASWLPSQAAFDWVLAADVVYHHQHDFGPVCALAALLRGLLAGGSARALIGYQERDGAAREAFWAALGAQGLCWREQGLAELGAEGVDVAGFEGPMVLWHVSLAQQAPAEA